MSYPNEIDHFNEKLNKKQDGSVYVIEEELTGNYDGPLAHDNINDQTVQIFTGSKLTGEKVENFILSVPSETPWQRLIKIFSDFPSVYVSYETPGDQVEADDINVLQDAVVSTQEELENHKSKIDNPHNVTKAQVGLGNVQNAGYSTQAQAEAGTASTTYMTPLRTKQAIDKLQSVKSVNGKTGDITLSANDVGAETPVGAQGKADQAETNAKNASAPSSHVGATGNAHGVATTSIAGFMSASDKSKLNGVEVGANKYVHPATHPPSIIAQDAINRFVTDTEKSNWNGKQSALGFTPENAANKGKANGYAGLDASGKVSISQLPGGLPASGGNADTLGGKAASDFMPKGPITWNQLRGV